MFKYESLENFKSTFFKYRSNLIWFKYSDGVRYIHRNGGNWLIQDISLFTYKHQNEFIKVKAVFNNGCADVYFTDENDDEWKKYHIVNAPNFENGEINLIIENGFCKLSIED